MGRHAQAKRRGGGGAASAQLPTPVYGVDWDCSHILFATWTISILGAGGPESIEIEAGIDPLLDPADEDFQGVTSEPSDDNTAIPGTETLYSRARFFTGGGAVLGPWSAIHATEP